MEILIKRDVANTRNIRASFYRFSILGNDKKVEIGNILCKLELNSKYTYDEKCKICKFKIMCKQFQPFTSKMSNMQNKKIIEGAVYELNKTHMCLLVNKDITKLKDEEKVQLNISVQI